MVLRLERDLEVVDERSKDEAIKLTYEELYFSEPSRQKEQIAAIWDMLQVARIESESHQYYLQPEAVKINSSATYALLPNAREIENACGNDMTGRLNA